jgi:hypothetical protein
MVTNVPRSSSESRGRARTARLLSQKAGPETVMVGVLVIALVLGLIGLAVHVLWIVAIIVMALGLGFAAANRRRDRLDVVNTGADRQDEQSAARPPEGSGPNPAGS